MAAILKHEVQRHQSVLDCEHLVLPAIAVICLPKRFINELRSDVVQDPVSSERIGFCVFVCGRFINEVCIHLTAPLANEEQELTTEKVTTVERCEAEKLRFAVRVPQLF